MFFHSNQVIHEKKQIVTDIHNLSLNTHEKEHILADIHICSPKIHEKEENKNPNTYSIHESKKILTDIHINFLLLFHA